MPSVSPPPTLVPVQLSLVPVPLVPVAVVEAETVRLSMLSAEERSSVEGTRRMPPTACGAFVVRGEMESSRCGRSYGLGECARRLPGVGGEGELPRWYGSKLLVRTGEGGGIIKSRCGRCSTSPAAAKDCAGPTTMGVMGRPLGVIGLLVLAEPASETDEADAAPWPCTACTSRDEER